MQTKKTKCKANFFVLQLKLPFTVLHCACWVDGGSDGGSDGGKRWGGAAGERGRVEGVDGREWRRLSEGILVFSSG